MNIIYEFVPPFRYITAITLGQTTEVTFSQAHRFTRGEYVSFRVSRPYGTIELNNLRGLVLEFDTLTIRVDIDSTNFTPFIYPVSGKNTPPVAVPAGSGIIPDSVPPTVNIEDAFDNILIN